MKTLNSSIGNIIKDRVKLKTLDLSMIRDIIAQSSKENKLVTNILSDLSTNERRTLVAKLDLLKKDKSKTNVVLYNKYVGKLRGKAKETELNGVFNSFITTASKFTEILTNIDKDLDDLFGSDKISIGNTKMSHVVIIGAIEESLTFADFCLYLFNGIVSDVTDELEAVPPYRTKFIEDNLSIVASIVNRIFTKTGADAYKACIANMKKENTNLLLLNEDNKSNTQFLKANSFNIGSKNLLTSGFINKNIFRWFGELLANRTHAKYQRMEREKEWMEAQVAVLKLDLDDTNPDDKQYRKMIKVIEAYDDLISKSDKKINSYYNK